jgi:hypothetical protein
MEEVNLEAQPVHYYAQETEPTNDFAGALFITYFIALIFLEIQKYFINVAPYSRLF